MELYETIEGMTSTDYRERFKAEYRQTKIRAVIEEVALKEEKA